MATIKVIQDFIQQYTDFETQNRAEIERRVKDQRERQAQIVQSTDSFCPIDRIQDRTPTADDVQRALKDGYGDASILKSLMCLNNSMMAFPKSSGVGRNFKVRKYLKNLKQIGTSSAEASAFGYAMTSDVATESPQHYVLNGDGKDLFVVKSPRDVGTRFQAEQIHEYFIGAFGTNNLRDQIPNFAYVLGYFQCSPPYLDNRAYIQGKSVNRSNRRDVPALTYCQNDRQENEVNYLLYENVVDSVTMEEFARTATLEDFINIFTQIVLALDIAYQEIDFTHYDLHDQNVLIRTLPEPIYIPYPVDEKGTIKYLKTKYVATIIDFGHSHIKYEGRNYGYAHARKGILHDRSYPMYDVYKLLMFNLSSMVTKDLYIEDLVEMEDDDMKKYAANFNLFQEAKELVTYFNPYLPRDQSGKLNGVTDYLAIARKYLFSLPIMESYQLRPLHFFQDALVAAFPSLINKFMFDTCPPDQMYGCGNTGVCKGLKQAINEYSVDDETLIRDPYMFFESLVEGRKQGDLAEVIRKGEPYFASYIDQLTADTYDYLEDYSKLGDGFTSIKFESISDEVKFDDQTLDGYRRYVATVVKLVDLMTTLQFIRKTGLKILQTYPHLARKSVNGINSQQFFDQLFEPVQIQLEPLNQIIRILKSDISYIKTYNQRAVIKCNPEAQWLFDRLLSLDSGIHHF